MAEKPFLVVGFDIQVLVSTIPEVICRISLVWSLIPVAGFGFPIVLSTITGVKPLV